jgi:hypothetical protein
MAGYGRFRKKPPPFFPESVYWVCQVQLGLFLTDSTQTFWSGGTLKHVLMVYRVCVIWIEGLDRSNTTWTTHSLFQNHKNSISVLLGTKSRLTQKQQVEVRINSLMNHAIQRFGMDWSGNDFLWSFSGFDLLVGRVLFDNYDSGKLFLDQYTPNFLERLSIGLPP